MRRVGTNTFFKNSVTFLRSIGVERGSRVVNIGPMKNYYSALAAVALGAHYLGFDLHQDNIDECKTFTTNIDGCEKICSGKAEHFFGEFSSEEGAISKSVISDGSIDHVLILTGALSDPLPESLAAHVFSEVMRVLRPSGSLLKGK